MDKGSAIKKAGVTRDTALAAILLAFIVFGLATKLYISAHMDLNSDMVGVGLQSMEIWKHQNFLLSGYWLPSDDTFIFTELLPFQLIPQVLTNYDPMALRLVSFVIFALAVGALSCVVYLASREPACALLFAALALNVPPDAYGFFEIPTSHIATMAFAGAIFALLLYMGRKDEGPIAKKRRRSEAPPAAGKPWAIIGVLAALTLLAALSDTIIFTWLIIPYIIAYAIFVKKKSRDVNLAIGCIVAVGVAAYIFKSFFVHGWVRQQLMNLSPSHVFSVNLPLSLKSLAILLNPGLYGVLNGFSGLGILEAASLVVFVALAAYAVKNALEDPKKRLFYGVLLASGIVMFAAFLVNDLVKDITQARYFTFTALAVLMLIATAYRKENKAYMALAVALIILEAAIGGVYVTQHGGQPNERQYGLISFLKENNLTFGYGTYWDSNVVTYLSGEDVTVRYAFFVRNGFKPEAWLGDERWYQGTPKNAFILVDNSSLSAENRETVAALVQSINASEPLHYKNYDVYPFEQNDAYIK